MKKILYLFLLVTVTYSCSTEEIIDFEEIIESDEMIISKKVNKSNKTIDKKKLSLKTLPIIDVNVLDFQSHKDMLAWNSFIVGEVMRKNESNKLYVLNAIDSVSKTVSMSTLLDQNVNNTFYNNYLYVATHTLMNKTICENPDTQDHWPPLDDNIPPLEFRSSKNVPNNITTLVNNLISQKTELFIPINDISDTIYTVGHPLVDQNYNIGSVIYNPPIFFNIANPISGDRLCIKYSEPSYIDTNIPLNNNFVILSRPNLSNSNPYSYIKFDINEYLQHIPFNPNDPNTTIYSN